MIIIPLVEWHLLAIVDWRSWRDLFHPAHDGARHSDELRSSFVTRGICDFFWNDTLN